MRVDDIRILELKVVVLMAAVTEIARELPPSIAANVATSLAKLLTDRLSESQLSNRADEALATDLAPLMGALQRNAAGTGA